MFFGTGIGDAMTLMLMGSGTAPLQPIADFLRTAFQHEILCCYAPQMAMQALQSPTQPGPDVLLADISGQSISGALRFLQAVRQECPELPLVVLTGFAQTEAAEGLFSLGSMDILTKPVPRARLKIAVANALKVSALRQEVQRLQLRERGQAGFDALVARSPGMQQAMHWARRMSTTLQPVWIQGEDGTGKEMFARAIHAESPRAARPFLSIACGISGDAGLAHLLHPTRPAEPSLLQQAQGGTLYLDAVEALSPGMHEMLAAHLQHQAQQGPALLEGGVRLIVSSQQSAQSTPSPLLHYLSTQWCEPPITLPPLRERREDLPELAQRYLRRYAATEGKSVHLLTPGALEWLQTQPWHGNLPELARQLRHAVWRCSGERLERMHLEGNPGPAPQPTLPGMRENFLPLLDEEGQLRPMEDLETRIMEFAVRHHGNCMARAARALSIGRSTLYRRLQEKVAV